MNSEKKEDQKYEKYTAVDDDQVYKDFLKKLDDDKKQISEFQHDDDAYMEFVNKQREQLKDKVQTYFPEEERIPPA